MARRHFSPGHNDTGACTVHNNPIRVSYGVAAMLWGRECAESASGVLQTRGGLPAVVCSVCSARLGGWVKEFRVAAKEDEDLSGLNNMQQYENQRDYAVSRVLAMAGLVL
ncbi:unnamed protein product [Chondrus crispus]|uniref:Uncharacterized protein n=1 Tax=Chondrus crispus TaxID=2769 RepID=R7Q4I1_CHOCR|nr:unnamed protein product [Chondrus crispus]CDF32778.1 unnamed protein product [Chondrus crispus]|eukprot:XP_005712579.1 unnamed protein product [Chondrus crispus]